MGAGKRKKFIAVSAVLVLCMMAGLFSDYLLGRAVFDDTQAVHINPDEIENSTLLMGTHLIYLGALNDTIYDIAVQSQEDSGQYEIYYKSELAGGGWFEITSASSIADITEEGTAVSNDMISALYLTHHTKSDGITYDLRTANAVTVFDIYPVYDLESLEELSQIKNQYDMYKEGTKNNATIKRNLKLVKGFFATNVSTKETDTCNLQIQALNEYLQVLRDNQASQNEIDAVEKIMGKIDAKRRAIVFRIVTNALEVLSDVAASEKVLNDSDKEKFNPDAELNTAISESQGNVENSLSEQEGNMLSEGTTVMTREEYILANRLITSALNRNHADCDTQTASLVRLYHITDGQITDAQGEAELLDQELIPMAEQTYLAGLESGETEEYRRAVESNASHVVLESILETQKNLLNTYRGELQFYIEARTKRGSEGEVQKYVNQRLDQALSFMQQIPKDAGYESAESTVEEHMTWLQNLLTNLASENGNHELAELYQEKEELQEKRMDALDRQDLSGAKQLEALVGEKDKEINSKETAVVRELEQLKQEKSKLESELAQSQTGGAGGQGGQTGEAGGQTGEAGGQGGQTGEAGGQTGEAGGQGGQTGQTGQTGEAGGQTGEAGGQTGEAGGQGGQTGEAGGQESTAGIVSRIAVLESRIALLQAGLSEGSAVKNIYEEKEKVLELLEEKLEDSQREEISSGIDAINALITSSHSAAGESLKEIYQNMASKKYLEDTTEYDVWMEQIEESIADNTEILDGVLNARETVNILEEALGCELTSGKDKNVGGSGEGSGTAGENGSSGTGSGGTGAGGSGSSGTGSGSSGGTGSSGGNGSSGTGSGGTGAGGSGNSGTGSGSSGGTGNTGGNGSSGTGSGGTGAGGSGNSGTGSGSSGGTGNTGGNGSGGTGSGTTGGTGSGGSGSSGTGSGSSGGTGNTGGNGSGGTGSGSSGGTGSSGGSGSSGTGSGGTGNSGGSGSSGGTGSSGGNESSGTGSGTTGGTGSGGNGSSGTGSGGTGAGGTGSSGTGSGGTGAGGTGNSGTGSGGTGAGGSGSSGTGSGSSGTGSGGTGAGGTGSSGTGSGNDISASGSGTTEKQAVALMALAMYDEQTESTEIEDLLAGLIQSLYKTEDSYLFQLVNESSGIRYVSAKAVSARTGYRYLWNDNKKKAILASGRKYYGFYAFKKEVDIGKEKKDTLTTETAFQSTVYIPEDYVKQEFGCEVYPISNTGYAMLADEKLLEQAAEVLDILIGRGGDTMG